VKAYCQPTPTTGSDFSEGSLALSSDSQCSPDFQACDAEANVICAGDAYCTAVQKCMADSKCDDKGGTAVEGQDVPDETGSSSGTSGGTR
jgi:hypothetical protein